MIKNTFMIKNSFNMVTNNRYRYHCISLQPWKKKNIIYMSGAILYTVCF